MKLANQYIIPFKGLKEGEHEFQFDFGKSFFDLHELLEANGGEVIADVLLIKRSTLLLLQISMTGSIEIKCDICLEYFKYPLHYSGELVVKYGDEVPEIQDDNLWVIHPNEYELDLNQYFFECIALCLPIKKNHPVATDGKPTCNQEMIKILKEHSGNPETEDSEIDPRWNKLKDLFNDTK